MTSILVSISPDVPVEIEERIYFTSLVDTRLQH